MVKFYIGLILNEKIFLSASITSCYIENMDIFPNK